MTRELHFYLYQMGSIAKGHSNL